MTSSYLEIKKSKSNQNKVLKKLKKFENLLKKNKNKKKS